MSAQSSWKRSIILFLMSQTVSMFGSMLVQYAIIWHITLTTQSGAALTVSILCGFLPMLVISPFAGVWADRYDRKRLVVISDATIAFVTLVMAISFFLGQASLWQMFAVLALRAFGGGVQSPAVNALIPQIVPPEHLTRVNGLNGSIQAAVTIVTPMLAGALLSFASIESIFFIDVGTAAIAIAILTLLLKIPSREKPASIGKVRYFADIAAGIGYIGKHRFIRSLFTYCGILYVFVAPLAFLTPLQVTRSFGDDVWRLTAIEVAFSGGMMVGGLLISLWGGFKKKAHTVILSIVVMSIGTFALGTTRSFWVYLAFMALEGIAMPLFNTPFTVLIQQHVREDYLGRVFSVFGMITGSVMPLAMLVFGPIADRLRIEWLLMGSGIAMLATGTLMLASKVLVGDHHPDTV